MVFWLVTLTAGAPPDFDREIAPLLARRCLSCHAGEGPKGGLDLTTRANALRGGDSGPALAINDLPKSGLWQRIADDEMPPKHPLPAEEKALLHAWLTS
ncbi:MAG TPA: c-type cytochrome domain-containing protein, partial [Planctomycetaceae bacterium]|nr:c-type cytochrome domain-containing protein [Planctomycetaceae bacterium]